MNELKQYNCNYVQKTLKSEGILKHQSNTQRLTVSLKINNSILFRRAFILTKIKNCRQEKSKFIFTKIKTVGQKNHPCDQHFQCYSSPCS